MDQDNKEMPSIHGAFDKLGRQGLDWTGLDQYSSGLLDAQAKARQSSTG